MKGRQAGEGMDRQGQHAGRAAGSQVQQTRLPCVCQFSDVPPSVA